MVVGSVVLNSLTKRSGSVPKCHGIRTTGFGVGSKYRKYVSRDWSVNGIKIVRKTRIILFFANSGGGEGVGLISHDF
jgi:hypothetical protein